MNTWWQAFQFVIAPMAGLIGGMAMVLDVVPKDRDALIFCVVLMTSPAYGLAKELFERMNGNGSKG